MPLGQQDVECLLQSGQVMPMQEALAASAACVIERAKAFRQGWVRMQTQCKTPDCASVQRLLL